MFARLPFVLGTLAAVPLFAANALAGHVTVGFGHNGQHGSIGVQVGFPLSKSRPAPPQYGGHWETVVERVWVPGACERIWVPPLYETRYDSCGRPRSVCIRAGYWDLRQYPGHYEERTRQVWRTAGWRNRPR
jgi:hypothetical protein